MANFLCVDDDLEFTSLLPYLFKKQSHNLDVANDLETGLGFLNGLTPENSKYNGAIIDWKIQNAGGDEVKSAPIIKRLTLLKIPTWVATGANLKAESQLQTLIAESGGLVSFIDKPTLQREEIEEWSYSMSKRSRL